MFLSTVRDPASGRYNFRQRRVPDLNKEDVSMPTSFADMAGYGDADFDDEAGFPEENRGNACMQCGRVSGTAILMCEIPDCPSCICLEHYDANLSKVPA